MPVSDCEGSTCSPAQWRDASKLVIARQLDIAMHCCTNTNSGRLLDVVVVWKQMITFQAQLQAICIDVLERCGPSAPPITLLLAHALTRTPTCSPRYTANADHACSRRRRKGHVRCQWQLVAGIISSWPEARCVHPCRGSRVRLPWRVRACVV